MPRGESSREVSSRRLERKEGGVDAWLQQLTPEGEIPKEIQEAHSEYIAASKKGKERFDKFKAENPDKVRMERQHDRMRKAILLQDQAKKERYKENMDASNAIRGSRVDYVNSYIMHVSSLGDESKAFKKRDAKIPDMLKEINRIRQEFRGKDPLTQEQLNMKARNRIHREKGEELEQGVSDSEASADGEEFWE
jgi:hypothetical protein